jgi:hypothetical protein
MHMCTKAYMSHVYHVHRVDAPVIQAEYTSVANIMLIAHM